MDNFIQNFKKQPKLYGSIIVAFTITIFFIFGNLNSNKNNQQQINNKLKETSVLKTKSILENTKQKNKEKLKIATNPSARKGEILNKIKKENNPESTVIKNKYSNVKNNDVKIEYFKLKKEKEKRKKELIEKENKIKELELKLKREKKRKEKMQKELEIKKLPNPKKEYQRTFSENLEPELRNVLVTEALEEGQTPKEDSSTVVVFRTKKVKIKPMVKKEIPQNISKKRFKIVAGSSFYGELTNVIYSGYPEAGAIVTINNPKFNGCNFIGAPNINAEGIGIKIFKMSCKDGYEQSVNAYAFRMSDLKPIFADEINTHLFPKIVIGSLDALLNITRTKDGGGSVYTTGGVIQTNTSLVDSILKEELQRYKTEIIAKPQGIIVIFY